MVEATVETVGLVGEGFALQGGGNRGLCGGASFAAGGHLAVVHFRVRTGAEGAKGSLKQWLTLLHLFRSDSSQSSRTPVDSGNSTWNPEIPVQFQFFRPESGGFWWIPVDSGGLRQILI